MMPDSDVRELFTATPDTDEPALPAGYAEQTLALARRDAWRRRMVPTGAVALAVLVFAVLAIAPWRFDQRPAQPTDRPSLPTEFAALSDFTSWATDRPAGRAIALYQFGNTDGLFRQSVQTLVVGADRDTYRQVETTSTVEQTVLLSPDGRYLLYFHPRKGTDEFTLIDLTTGQTTVRHSVEWISNVGAYITLLAWSPDGRYVAYAVPSPVPEDHTAESSFVSPGVPKRNLAILDLTTDTTVRSVRDMGIHAAAFSPDSQRLAVFAEPQAVILSLSGEQVGVWTPPAGMDGYSGIFWSPDGRLLATTAGYGGTNMRIHFIDLTGTDAPVPADVPGWSMLGWRTPTSIVVFDWQSHAIVDVSTVDGHRTVLSRFSRAKTCGIAETCDPVKIQLASNLLRQAGIRPSDPDRGPVVAALEALPQTLVVVVAGFFVAAIVASARNTRRRRRRRRHLPPSP